MSRQIDRAPLTESSVSHSCASCPYTEPAAAGRASPWTNDARSSLNPCDLYLTVVGLDDSLDASAPVATLAASMCSLSPEPITPNSLARG